MNRLVFNRRAKVYNQLPRVGHLNGLISKPMLSIGILSEILKL